VAWRQRQHVRRGTPQVGRRTRIRVEYRDAASRAMGLRMRASIYCPQTRGARSACAEWTPCPQQGRAVDMCADHVVCVVYRPSARPGCI